MGCCPIFAKRQNSTQYQIMNQDEKPKLPNNSELNQECQEIDIQNDDFFEKSEKQKLAIKNPSKKLITINDFNAINIIGRGGFGKVLLVEKKDTKKLYAMKIIKKELISERNQQIHTIAERKILENMKCPFIVQLNYAFQSKTRLYLVMDFVIGGQLFFHLRREKRFSQDKARIYAAQLILALKYLHQKKIIYRDLKPQNILVAEDGYLKITDFGLSKVVVDSQKNYTFCGTPEYLAPEIYLNKGHEFTCDWWSLGALIYEMLSGAPPFYSKDKKKMLQDRLNKNIIMRDHFSEDVIDLLRGLLNNNVKLRLGKNGVQQIMSHRFFKSVDWQNLYKKQIKMPYIPNVNDNKDLNHFDKVFTDQPINETPTKSIREDYEGYTYQKNTVYQELNY